MNPSEILNHLRTQKISEQLPAEDVRALHERETGRENDAIHIVTN